MSEVNQQLALNIRNEVESILDPELRRSLGELKMIEKCELVIDSQGELTCNVTIKLTIAGCPMRDELNGAVESAIAKFSEIKSIHISFTAMTPEERDEVKKLLRGGREKFIPFAQPGSLTRVIGIASGKGGVGKSSLTANLAVAIAQLGFSVGVLDADVYGHSIPRALGLIGQHPTSFDQMFIPLENYGVKCVSIEMFKAQRSDPVAYRGPLLHRVLEQLLSDAYWGDLDFLLLDLPPGTGDIAISLGQLIPNSEIVVVTTPQLAAAEVAERAGRVAHQLNQKILGVIENMSAIKCPHCEESIDLFGSGGGQDAAKRLTELVGYPVDLIGQVPFDPALREGGDEGVPLISAGSQGACASAIHELARKLTQRSESLVGVRLPLN
jgi:ATP-binding protein involved in chromosome partitioning